MGTALTPQQLGLLRRYADEAILFFDADRAGQEAARRAEDLLERSADPQWWALSKAVGHARAAGPPAPGRDAALRSRPRHVHSAPKATTRSRPPAAPLGLAPSVRARSRVLRGGHGEPAWPRHRQRPRGPHAVEGAGRRRGDRARPRGGRRLGVDPSDLWLQAQRLVEARSGRRCRRPPGGGGVAGRDVVRAGPLPAGAPGSGRARQPCLPLIDTGRHRCTRRARAILAALPRRAGDWLPRRSLQRLPTTSGAPLLARWLVEEREWPGLAAEVAACRRRLERRQAQRRSPRDLADGRAVRGRRTPPPTTTRSMPPSDGRRPESGPMPEGSA